MSQLEDFKSWKALKAHYENEAKFFQMDELFAKDPDRFDVMSAAFGNIPHETLPLILLDYSKNIISRETFKLLLDLALEAKVEECRNKMFMGEKVNST